MYGSRKGPDCCYQYSQQVYSAKAVGHRAENTTVIGAWTKASISVSMAVATSSF